MDIHVVIVVYGSDIGIAGLLEVTSVLGLWTGGGQLGHSLNSSLVKIIFCISSALTFIDLMANIYGNF